MACVGTLKKEEEDKEGTIKEGRDGEEQDTRGKDLWADMSIWAWIPWRVLDKVTDKETRFFFKKHLEIIEESRAFLDSFRA